MDMNLSKWEIVDDSGDWHPTSPWGHKESDVTTNPTRAATIMVF